MGAAVIPNLDSVAEFRLITNSFDAEYGRFSGAVMNAITKSGTNGFHGTAFEFLRNNKLDSRAFFDPSVTVLKRNQFGYAVGGPALKNKLFWFTDYQGTRQISGVVRELDPAPERRAAERKLHSGRSQWSGQRPLLGTGPEPATGLPGKRERALQHAVLHEYGSLRLSGWSHSRAAFSPIASTLLKNYVPLPNAGGNTYIPPSVVSKLNDDRAGQRVDINNRRDRKLVRLLSSSTTLLRPRPGIYGPQYGNFGSFTPRRAQQGVLANVKEFGPSTVNEARVDFTRIATRRTSRPTLECRYRAWDS